jgi:hypothetical protein
MFLIIKPLKAIVAITLKSFNLILILIISSMAARAQVGSYQPFSIGAGYGVTIAFAGEQTLTSSNALDLNLNYNISPFATLSLEGQFGQLSSGDSVHDSFAKQFLNSYNAIILHADLQGGELFDYSHSEFLNGLKNLYLGVGMGFLSNKITSIQLINPANKQVPLNYAATSSNFLVPVRVGYEFKIFNHYDEPQVRFDITYSFNTAFGQGLDGYIYPHGAAIKFYNYISAGFKYSFGGVHLYRKDISYSYF